MSTLRISNIEAKSVPASATIDEKVKITNSSGDTLVFIDGKTSGITTVGINTTDSNITFDANSNVVVTGIITATKFSGQFEPTSLDVSTNLTLGGDIIHSGDDTKIRFPSNDLITFETAGTESARIDSNGQLLVGTTTAGANVRAVFQGYNGGGENFQARVQFQTNQATNLTAQSHLANLLFTNASSSLGARIDVKADANWGTGSYPSRIEFGTTPSGANTPTERLRIKSNGQVDIASNNYASGHADTKLRVGTESGSSQATAVIGSADQNIPALIITNWDGSTTTNKNVIRFDNSGRGTYEIGGVGGANAFAITIDTSEKLRIDSTGRVAVNQPAGTGFTTGKVHIKSSASNIGQLYLEQNNATDGFMINQDGPNGGHLKFVRDIGGTQTVNVLFRSDRGICFNGDTAAANALDDYEEGSWTASVTGGNSITTNAAYYTKIGRMVYWMLHCTPTFAQNNTTTYEIYGLPFTSANITQNYGWSGNITYSQNGNNSVLANMRPLVQMNNTYIYFHTVGLGSSDRIKNNFIRSTMLNQHFLLGGFYCAAT